MQLEELTYLLKHPETISETQITALKTEIEAYPYFQPLRALLLKGLKQKGSYKYNTTLKETAAYTTNRSVLFNYITSEVFNQNNISEHTQHNYEYIKDIDVTVEDISIEKSTTIDDTLQKQIEDTKGVLDPNLFETKPEIEPQTNTQNESENLTHLGDEKIDHFFEEASLNDNTFSLKNILTKNNQNTIEEQLNIGKPLSFNTNEQHSFSEWLKLTSAQPINREENTIKEPLEDKQEEIPEDTTPLNPLDDKLAIIDKFLEENPKIKPVKQDDQKPILIKTDDAVSKSMMTETLARIYLEQKNYKKAIKAYKILSLKYPEKSSFFANQIELIKELKDQK